MGGTRDPKDGQMRMRTGPLLLSGALLLAPLVAACGGDDSGKKDDTKTESTADDAGSSTTLEEGSGSLSGPNEALEKYCRDVDAFIADAKAAVSSRDQGALDGLAARGQEINQEGTDLAPTLDEADAPQLQQCAAKLQSEIQSFTAAYSGMGR
jgi:hypothetical protein